MEKHLWTRRVRTEQSVLNHYRIQQVSVQNPTVFCTDGDISKHRKGKTKCVKISFLMSETWGRKVSKDFQASQVKTSLADNTEELPFLKVVRVRRCWSLREVVRRAGSKYRSDIKRELTYQMQSTKYLLLRGFWGLCPASFFLSGFLWGQISCTR